MYFLVRAFCILLVLNNYEASVGISVGGGVFTFNAMPLCHSGLLITWKPDQDHENLSERVFRPIEFSFAVYLVDEKQNKSILIFHNTIKHLSFEGQHKIHSLNESTVYKVEINQRITFGNDTTTYNEDPDGNYGFIQLPPHTLSVTKQYVTMKTNSKCKGSPAKPDFEFIPEANNPIHGEIKWYPCGRERNCTNQESGTHFGIIIEVPYNTKKSKELQVSREEFYADYVSITIWPSKIYEVVVYSVNDQYITYSDLQELFVKPKFSQVQYVKVISLPDFSVLLSWKKPKYALDATPLKSYYAHCFEDDNSRGDQILFPQGFSPSVIYQEDVGIPPVPFDENDQSCEYEQTRIFGLKPENTYNCVIIPCGRGVVGNEYSMEYKLKIYNHELQIAKPDFIYKLFLIKKECLFYFQWLPCGQSFDCKNTRPGSNYTFLIDPQPQYANDKRNVGLEGEFKVNVEYNVTVKSFIANTFSESVTRIFKSCVEIR